MNELRDRDALEHAARAFGEPVPPDQVPDGLAWQIWQPVAQKLYYWTWAARDGWLYGRLHDTHGPGGTWRLPLTRAFQQAWSAIARHLGPMGIPLLAMRLIGSCLALA